MAKIETAGLSDDPEAWLALAGALVSLGVFPKAWQKTIGTAVALLWLYRRL